MKSYESFFVVFFAKESIWRNGFFIGAEQLIVLRVAVMCQVPSLYYRPIEFLVAYKTAEDAPSKEEPGEARSVVRMVL